MSFPCRKLGGGNGRCWNIRKHVSKHLRVVRGRGKSRVFSPVNQPLFSLEAVSAKVHLIHFFRFSTTMVLAGTSTTVYSGEGGGEGLVGSTSNIIKARS